MGLFSNPFPAIMTGFDDCCCVKRVQGVRTCVEMKSTNSDHIIQTLLSFTERAALVKGRVICTGHRVPTMAKVNIFCYVHLLN